MHTVVEPTSSSVSFWKKSKGIQLMTDYLQFDLIKNTLK